MLMRSPLLTGAAWALTATIFTASCSKPAPERKQAEPSPAESAGAEPPVVRLDPSTAVPVDILIPKPPDPPDGYPYTKAKIGPPIYTGKWLAMNEGQGVTFGPKHVLVHHFAERPRPFAQGKRTKTVLVNLETGDVPLELGPRRYFEQWYFGLAIVFKADDDRPYLLDAEYEDLVLAVPEGAHEYELGENYWIRLSPSHKRVWITAQAADGTVHLYEWEDRRQPPEMPNNPFPFMPRDWEPNTSSTYSPSDVEEVIANYAFPYSCDGVILVPPKSFRCITDSERLAANGWVSNSRAGKIYNLDTKEKFDLDDFCGRGVAAGVQPISRMFPTFELTCPGTDGRRFWYWRPPNQLTRLPDHLGGTPDRPSGVSYDRQRDRHVLVVDKGDALALVSGSPDANDHIGRYPWHDGFSVVWPADRGDAAVLIRDRHENQVLRWTDIVDRRARLRARVSATEVAMSPSGLFVGLMGRRQMKLVRLRMQ